MIISSALNSPAIPGCDFPVTSFTWNDVARLCRRICLLEERGERGAAEQLRAGALAEALLALRPAGGEPDETVGLRLATILAAEQERVANAVVLAELMAPLLREQARAGAAGVAPPVAPGDPNAPTSSPIRSAARASPATIADFIDEMLAQERDAPKPAVHRRAS